MKNHLKIAVLDDYLGVAASLGPWQDLPPGTEVKYFTEPIQRVLRAQALADFHVLVLMRERMPLEAELVHALPQLRLVVTTGPRNAAIDIRACDERGIPVLGTRSMPGITAETAWLLILGLAKQLRENSLTTSGQRWQQALPDSLEGLSIGIVGLGDIGRRMALVARGFGMNVLAWSQNLSDEQARQVGASRVDKATLFRESDVVTLHLRLSDRTRHVVGRHELATMKLSAVIVNTSRAGLIDESALFEVLTEGRIAGAGLDVFSEEPLPDKSPWRSLPNVLLTPHLGYVSRQNLQIYYADAVENILGWIEGQLIRPVTE